MGTAKKTPPLSPLQERFIKLGLKDLREPEILELLLSLSTPDKDYHALANRIVTRFTSLKQLLNTPAEQIQRIPGVSSRDHLVLLAMMELSQKYLKDTILDRPIYQVGRVIFDYLYQEMWDQSQEHFKLVCLDAQKKIIKTSGLFSIRRDASLAQSSRLVIENAIKHKARYFIVVHNHTSGDPRPSKNDLDITRDLVFAGMIIQIKLLDHVIFGDDSFYSFSNEGLIEEYEAEYQELKLRGTTEAKRRLKAAKKTADKT
jgi:DNA repair protein RadC